MSNKDYKKAILDGLLKKYNNRYAKNITTNRRIILKPIEVYKDYARNNADILEKQGINEAVSVLTGMGFVSIIYYKTVRIMSQFPIYQRVGSQNCDCLFLLTKTN